MLSVDFPPPQICQFQLVMGTHLSNHELKSVENYFSVIKSSTGSAFQKDKCEHPPSYLGLGCGLLRAYGVFSLKGRFHCYVFSKNPFTFPIKELWRADAMLCSRLNSGQVLRPAGSSAILEPPRPEVFSVGGARSTCSRAPLESGSNPSALRG